MKILFYLFLPPSTQIQLRSPGGQDKSCSMWLIQVSLLSVVFQTHGEHLARQTFQHGSPTLINLALCYNGKMTGLQHYRGPGWVFYVQRGRVSMGRFLPPAYHRHLLVLDRLCVLSRKGSLPRILSTVHFMIHFCTMSA